MLSLILDSMAVDERRGTASRRSEDADDGMFRQFPTYGLDSTAGSATYPARRVFVGPR